MNILITNDDGIKAKGISILIEALKPLGNLYVVAPEEHKSGASVSLTVGMPLQVKRYTISGVKEAYSVLGTPADCVRLSKGLFEEVTFDVLISGINQGTNTASDVYHSGTLGAALEGIMLDIPSIALSGNYYDFSLPKKYSYAVVKYLIDHNLHSKDYALNVNFPKEMDEVKVVFTHHSTLKEKAYFHKDGDNYTYAYRRSIPNDQSDLYYYYNNTITITPIGYDKTDYKALESLKQKQTQLKDVIKTI